MSYAEKSAIAFDLDGTLTPSKQPIEKEMAELFCRLLQRADKKIAVMSGGRFDRFHTQFLDHLPCAAKDGDKAGNAELFKNLYLFPLDGSTFYLYKDGSWRQTYNEPLTKRQKDEIISAIRKAEVEILGSIRNSVYGEVIQDRGSQITFSALGQDAPLSEKLRWDPDHAKRKRITEFLQPLLPNYDVKIGGTTTVDVNKKGVNKAYALHKMEEYSGVPIADTLFVGDAIFKWGNDYQALETGVDYIKVRGPEDTAKVIREILGI